ncbi:universal stress protein [Mucilaginibacter sp. SMC90]|uniref:universal stress protein n=1 Tax=Mucilaginibacter sp. SMC90 TaxID=2929803 RepID=UPI001FB371B1|nr:universal stress protein [Mucilaginibacter sp. SMC90]UOE49783.1 universal stress protein [Mucilaginibacter sp. SMC90]
MKTILVLTDFSINADYVAHYALELAQQLRANLLVCNVYQDNANEKSPDEKSWPLRACEEASINDLGELTARLKARRNKQDISSDGFRPEILQCSLEGVVDQQLKVLTAKHDLLMAVISNHSANNLSGDFGKNHTKAIIEKAGIPVLVVPYQVRFKPYRNIVFASAMNADEIPVLRSLTDLAKHSDATLLLAHVAAVTSGTRRARSAFEAFCDQIPARINYPNISYANINAKDVARGLKETTADTAVDLLVLVHRRRSRFQQLFGGSITSKMLTRPYKPLLVFPGSTINAS